MIHKLKRVIVDDDDAVSMKKLTGYCQALPYVEVVGSFKSPKGFIEALIFMLIFVTFGIGTRSTRTLHTMQ